jgi:hypothetical protein
MCVSVCRACLPGGIVLFQELRTMAFASVCMFLFGVLLTFLGVYVPVTLPFVHRCAVL